MHAANLALRFGLELAALAGIGAWALRLYPDWRGPGVAFVLIILVAVAWTSFATPGDPSRSGRAPVRTSGPLRLVLELVVLGGGASCWYVVGRDGIALVFAVLLAAHYVLSIDRVRWLLSQR